MALKNAFEDLATDAEVVKVKREIIDVHSQLLAAILDQLKLINLHLQEAYDDGFTVEDLDDNIINDIE